MAQRLSIWVTLIGMLAVTACSMRQAIVGSGNIVGESYDFADFDRLIVHGNFDVTVLQGDGYAVEVSADDNLLKYVALSQRGNTLEMGLSQNLDLEDATLLAVVHLPQLTRVNMQGASRLRLESLESDLLELELNGTSRVTGDVVAQQIELELSGACGAELAGQTETLVAQVTGASQADLKRMIVTRSGSIEAHGASAIEVHAEGELTLEATGAAKIRYAGNPKIIDSESSGASSIKPQ